MKRYNPSDNIMVIPSAQYPHMISMPDRKNTVHYDLHSPQKKTNRPDKINLVNRTAISVMSTITGLILKWRSER